MSTQTDPRAHIETITREAGLEMMSGVFDVIIDREEVADEQILALSAKDISEFYEGFIARAIDKVEDSLLDAATA